MTEAQESELNRRYSYHPPKGDQQERYEKIRAAARVLAEVITDTTPFSREQSTALTALDSVVFNSNAAIARNE